MAVWRSVRVLIVGLLVLVGLMGCGGDDDTKKVAADDTEETTTTEDDSGDGADVAAILGDEDCRFLVEAFASNPFASAASGDSEEDIANVANAFREAAKKAPDEISDDFEIFAELYTEAAPYITAMAKAGGDPSKLDPEAMQALSELGEKFSSPEYAKAAENVSAYMQANCSGAAN